MLGAILCREFGWTWQEYENQPVWFLDTVVIMLQEESQKQKKEKQSSYAEHRTFDSGQS